MVVGAHTGRTIVDRRFGSLWRRFGCGSVYLHPILKKEAIQVWKTILVLVLASVIAFLIWRVEWILLLGIGIGLIALLSTRLATLIHRGWMKLAEGLGWLNSRILLGIIFYFLLTPIALLVRLFRKDPLQLRRPKTDSLWHERDHLYRPEDLQNPW